MQWYMNNIRVMRTKLFIHWALAIDWHINPGTNLYRLPYNWGVLFSTVRGFHPPQGPPSGGQMDWTRGHHCSGSLGHPRCGGEIAMTGAVTRWGFSRSTLTTSGRPPTSNLKNFSLLSRTLYGLWWRGERGGTTPPFLIYTNSACCRCWRLAAVFAYEIWWMGGGCMTA